MNVITDKTIPIHYVHLTPPNKNLIKVMQRPNYDPPVVKTFPRSFMNAKVIINDVLKRIMGMVVGPSCYYQSDGQLEVWNFKRQLKKSKYDRLK